MLSSQIAHQLRPCPNDQHTLAVPRAETAIPRLAGWHRGGQRGRGKKILTLNTRRNQWRPRAMPVEQLVTA